MTENHRDDELIRLIDDHVSGMSLPSGDIPSEYGPDSVQLLDVADLLWEAAHGAPPLERDPVAAMLGLVPDSTRSLSNEALQRALRGAGIKVSMLAQKLADRGWDVATRDVFNWQTRGDVTVPPALIQAIAEVVNVPPDKLTIDRGSPATDVALRSVTATAAFEALAERWARLRGTTVSLGASALQSRLAASVFRGSHPDEAQMLASLEALVSALESEPRRDNGR